MKKKHLVAAALAATVVGASSSVFAASNPFTDVPQGHWAYDAVAQLAADGVIEGYGDTTFQGDKNITRYEMAQMVAKAMAKKDVSAADKAAIDKLAAEFADELNNLGVRVANLEKNADNVRWSGSFTQKYMNNNIGRGVGSTGSTAWWEKELWLGLDARVNDQGWGVHSGIDTKWGTSKHFNEEEPLTGENGDQYGDNGSKHDVNFSLYTLNASGPLFKGADLTFGLFQPGLQNGYISNARTKGAKLSYHNGKTQFHVYGGRVYEKYGDLASTWSAFRRGGAELNGGADSATGHDLALDNWGTSIEYRFDGRTSAGIGYYALKHSDAYANGDTLGIVGVNFSRNLLPNLDLSGFYSHGNKHYQNKAYDIRLTYNGSEWGQKPWGAWFGYRYLGSDAQIMSGIDNAAEHPGIKGFEGSVWFKLAPNIRLRNWFILNGKPISTFHGQLIGDAHSAFASYLTFGF